MGGRTGEVGEDGGRGREVRGINFKLGLFAFAKTEVELISNDLIMQRQSFARVAEF